MNKISKASVWNRCRQDRQILRRQQWSVRSDRVQGRPWLGLRFIMTISPKIEGDVADFHSKIRQVGQKFIVFLFRFLGPTAGLKEFRENYFREPSYARDDTIVGQAHSDKSEQARHHCFPIQCFD